MSSDDLTKNLPTEDKIDSLIELVRQLASEVTEIKTRLTTLEQTVEQRLYDTRPIWEAVQAQLKQMNETLESVKEESRSINRRINLVHKEMLGIKEEQEILHERIDKLEKEPA